jgi:hypothetical protein
MVDKNSGFVESEQVFGVDRGWLYCGNPKKSYTETRWIFGFSDRDGCWDVVKYEAIYVYRPSLAGWVFWGEGDVSEERLVADLVLYTEVISIEEAKARFPEAFPMREVEP